MSTVTTRDGVEIFYKDWGSGQPIVFSHGWPLSADDWDAQLLFFLGKGYRVIAHDRRGHGRSSQTGGRSRHGSLCRRPRGGDVASRPSRTRFTSAIRPAAAKWCITSPGTAKAAWRRPPSSARSRR